MNKHRKSDKKSSPENPKRYLWKTLKSKFVMSTLKVGKDMTLEARLVM